MNHQNFKKHIETVLKQDERLWYQEEEQDGTTTTELNQTLLIDLAEKYDEKILSLLFKDAQCKAKFFVKVAENYVFKNRDFQFFLEENKIDNSYTQYKNRIGLSDGRRFIKDTNDVVINFPYKDGVLQGGQSTEEGQDTYFEKDNEHNYQQKQTKRKEIFFNEVLAADEIDRLKDEKALVNFKRFSKEKQQEVKEIKRDENGRLKENLIIKGNNLLALCSLKKQFANKIKLIYIDPPYNTGNDGFKYNDNFNHSAWLVFMKNRLEIAKQLLREDGVIFVQCDDNEQAYLKVLMDEVFGRDNFVANISVKVSSESGVKVNANKPVRVKESILIFQKLKFIYKKQFVIDRGYSQNYSYFIKEKFEDPNKWEILTVKNAFKKKFGKLGSDNDLYNFQLKYKNQIFSVRDISNSLKKEFGGNPNQFIIKKDKNNKILWKKGEIVFFSNRVKIIDGKEDATKYLSDIWADIKWDGIAGEGKVTLKNGKKPEALLQRIIEIATQKGDIVLDYHVGSGTTAAVAHKMGRQYIGIEQMDYTETIAVERLKKVIEGEQGGISKAVEWKGGGDFIYCELAKWNEKAKEKIEACKNLEELTTFFDEMIDKYFLNYNLKIKEFKEKVLKEPEFKNLSLDKQKQMFCAMLDNNQMYINRSEVADKKYGLCEEDIENTKAFYRDE